MPCWLIPGREEPSSLSEKINLGLRRIYAQPFIVYWWNPIYYRGLITLPESVLVSSQAAYLASNFFPIWNLDFPGSTEPPLSQASVFSPSSNHSLYPGVATACPRKNHQHCSLLIWLTPGNTKSYWHHIYKNTVTVPGGGKKKKKMPAHIPYTNEAGTCFACSQPRPRNDRDEKKWNVSNQPADCITVSA